MTIQIRYETPSDVAAIEALTIAAFSHAPHTSHTEHIILRALRDSELLLIPNAELDRIAARSTHFSLALARLCARRLRNSNRQGFNGCDV